MWLWQWSRKTLIPRGDVDRASMTSSRSDLSNDNAPTPSMFGDNTNVYGGQFTIAETVKFNRAEAEDSFKLLQKRVATSAFHNSSQRVDPPRCHPRTREEILKKIYDWITQSEEREKWLLWLNGAAGAGKSAIMQSTAEKCALLTTIAVASFFFFRRDDNRNTIDPLVATLAYQLIRSIPETKDDIFLAIERDPLIFDQSLESQLQTLIIQPLLRLPRELQRLFVVFIDGLDECIDHLHQSNLIKVLGNVSCRRNIPVVFLVASRREYQIEAAFGLDPVAHLLTTIPLDNSDIEKTSDDIRRFVTDKSIEIKETHLRRRLLPPDWPPISAIEEIVAKSSGQFIFASVVINYISSPRYNPARQLELVRDIHLREASSQNPFAHLDALYQHIFSQVEAVDEVLDILALALLTKVRQVSVYESIFQLAHGELEMLLADLSAVIECKPDHKGFQASFSHIKFLHASLPDFLQDSTRSGIYYIDIEEYRTKLLCTLLERPPPVLLQTSHLISLATNQEICRLYIIGELFSKTKFKTPIHISNALMKFNFMLYSREMADDRRVQECYVAIQYFLHKQHFHDQGKAALHIEDLFSPGYMKFGVNFYHWPSEDWSDDPTWLTSLHARLYPDERDDA